MTPPARIVVVEGLPGAGKTTLIRRLAAETGAAVVEEWVAPPAAAPAGGGAADAAAGDAAAARNDLLKSSEMGGAGGTVLVDRYFYSTVSHVLARDRGRVDPASFARCYRRLYGAALVQPTHLVILRIGARESLRRLAARDGPSVAGPWSSPRFLAALERFYADLGAARPGWPVTGTPPDVRVVGETSENGRVDALRELLGAHTR